MDTTNNPIQIFATEDGTTEIQVRLRQDTVWLSQAQMETLFDKSKKTISEHISNVFKEGELERGATVRKFRIVHNKERSHTSCHMLTPQQMHQQQKLKMKTYKKIKSTGKIPVLHI